MFTSPPLISVHPGNVVERGFFCCMSKRKSEGYQRKLRWLEERFTEGLRITLLGHGERGFIEYIPGEFAWRAVDAAGWMFIHCIWVVGMSKKRGHASLLLESCVDDARASGMEGVAIATSSGNWLVGSNLFMKHGFSHVEIGPPPFALLALPFGNAPLPRFRKALGKRASKYPHGLTVFRSDQCPYLQDAVDSVREIAQERDLPYREIEMNTAKRVQALSPHVYGVFAIVYKGRQLSHHYLLKKDVAARMDRMDASMA